MASSPMKSTSRTAWTQGQAKYRRVGLTATHLVGHHQAPCELLQLPRLDRGVLHRHPVGDDSPRHACSVQLPQQRNDRLVPWYGGARRFEIPPDHLFVRSGDAGPLREDAIDQSVSPRLTVVVERSELGCGVVDSGCRSHSGLRLMQQASGRKNRGRAFPECVVEVEEGGGVSRRHGRRGLAPRRSGGPSHERMIAQAMARLRWSNRVRECDGDG